jgi:AcrR family transcriptional regulator
MPDERRPIEYPKRRAAAERNRQRILAAAREALGESGDVSMAKIAKRAGVGMATLYRNFPGRSELLEAVYDEEVDALCAAAEEGGATPYDALVGWLRRFFGFVPSKRLIISELLEHGAPGSEGANPILGRNRARTLEAGEPLLAAAQAAGQVRDDLSLEQILDMIVAITRTPGSPDYLEPMFRVVVDGLRSETAMPGTAQAD